MSNETSDVKFGVWYRLLTPSAPTVRIFFNPETKDDDGVRGRILVDGIVRQAKYQFADIGPVATDEPEIKKWEGRE